MISPSCSRVFTVSRSSLSKDNRRANQSLALCLCNNYLLASDHLAPYRNRAVLGQCKRALTHVSSLQNHCFSLYIKPWNPSALSTAQFCLSLRKAVEEAMDPGLAGVTAYVSQDCTGMKDEPAVDKTGSWAHCQNWPLSTLCWSAGWLCCCSGRPQEPCLSSNNLIGTNIDMLTFMGKKTEMLLSVWVRICHQMIASHSSMFNISVTLTYVK